MRQQPAKSASPKRRHLLETLEPRQLLAGPQLIGIQPNEGALIDDGAVRTVAPRSLTFRFDEAQSIDPNTFGGIQIWRSGSDGTWGTGDDVWIEPGSVTLGDIHQNEVVVRFAENLPDDHYRIDVYAFDDPSQGIVALRNQAGEAFQPSTPGVQSTYFQLNLGALVEAVVPQPVVRLADGSLQQRRDEIVVYFNEDPLFVENDPATGLPTNRSAEHPRFYQLLLTQETVRTTDDVFYQPQRVIYDPGTHTARLIFADDINELAGVPLGGGTFRLRIGTAVDSRDELILEPSRLQPSTAVGDTVTTSYDLNADSGGVRFVTDGSQTSSVIVPGAIAAVGYEIDLPGSSNDPGRLQLPESVGGGLLQTINERFGADSTAGVTEIEYNFQAVYAMSGGNTLLNQITDRQKTRVREALSLWANYLGVQFRETATSGMTFAVGDPDALASLPDTQRSSGSINNALNASLRIDPTYTQSAMVFSNETQFNTAYGEDFFRKTMAGVGFLLGLEQSREVTAQSLMALSSTFLNQTINPTLASGAVNLGQLRDLEPSFPSNQDILHGQHVHRPDSVDVNLYRFEVDLDGTDRTGTFTAEIFAERLADASSLDGALRLFQEVQASLTTDLGLGTGLSLRLTAIPSAGLGNHARIDFVRVQTGSLAIQQQYDDQGQPIANAISIQVPRSGSVSVGQLIDAIYADPFASSLFHAELLVGDAATNIVSGALDRPLLLSGGELIELARNNDYYSNDSFLTANLASGVYYIGVAAAGNDRYDPQLTGSGFGGTTQGEYELSLKFEPQVGEVDTIRDRDSARAAVPGTALDGDGDGLPGGVKNFWFQTRPLNRFLEVTANGSAITPGQTFTIVGANGQERRFEFVPSGQTAVPGNVAIMYTPGADQPQNLANSIRAAITQVASALGVTVSIPDNTQPIVELIGERSISFSSQFRGVEALGRTVFVDKVAGVNADGSLAKPFNNISNPAVPNALGSVSENDIVRIVGNGGQDNNAATAGDNFAYKIGAALTGGGSLEDGRNLLVPKNVTVMIDAGAALKLRNAAIVVGSTGLLNDRSGSALQILGTPRLVSLADPVFSGNRVVNPGISLLNQTVISGDVVLTSIQDRSVDAASSGNSAAAAAGNWGGILFRRDLDQSQGRVDLEDEGIFLQTINHADIRYGGGSNVTIESIQQTVNPIQMANLRPNVTFNTLTKNAGAAMSASPDSFEETSYQAPRYQQAGAFTADYGRVGPDIKNNVLQQNSINGLFIKAETGSSATPSKLTVAGRLDDTDIVHYVAENIVIAGNPGGSIQDGVRPGLDDVAGVAVVGGGQLAAGSYQYQLTFVDRFGFESLAASSASSPITAAAGGGIELFNLPAVPSSQEYVSRRLYRLAPGSSEFVLVSELDASSSQFFDNGQRSGVALDTARQGIRGRLNASLVIDPGTIVKLSGARIELEQGSQLLAEGLPGLPVVFTSVADDRYGAGGSFDTNNDSAGATAGRQPSHGDWAGIYAGPTANVSLSTAVIAYGGGVSVLESGQSKAFSALELHQATARVVDSRFEYNANGQGGQGPVGRNGRLGNTPSTVFVRYSQPVLVGNEFVENYGPIIDIDSDSFGANYRVDLGRETGALQRLDDLDDNHGPLVRRNTTLNTPTDSGSQRQLNGMYIRGGVISTSSVWDDTDIVHMLFDSITVGNQISGGELRLQSRPNESLVIKLSGSGNANQDLVGTGFNVMGGGSASADRIGGTLHVIGMPGAPVVMTSIYDDSVGAGRRLDGSEQTDTNGDGHRSRPFPNDWRGLYISEFANNRNVATIAEQELSTEVAPGLNATVENAQYLGELAESLIASDENLRLGFEVHGFLSGAADVDTYSFTGAAGTPIWVDIDKTSVALDSVIELLDSEGNVLARSDDSFAEAADPSLIAVPGASVAGKVGSLSRFDGAFAAAGQFGQYQDVGSANPYDAGLSVTLPGPVGARSVYYVRVRSASVNAADEAGGLTRGGYALQVRLTEGQEFAGTTVQFADIRYANHGIHMQGMPGTSPLLGEVAEDESGGFGFQFSNNSISGGTPGQRAQYVGNLANTRNGAISIAGSLSSGSDIDFYYLQVNHGLSGLQHSTVFDIDYADGLNRPDSTLSVFYDDGSGPRLVLVGTASNIADDQGAPLAAAASDMLSRGSVSVGDPFIGPVSLPQGNYYVAVTAAGVESTQLSSGAIRREPLDSVTRIFDDGIEETHSFGADAALQPRHAQFVQTAEPGWGITSTRSRFLPATFNGSRSSGSGAGLSYHFDRSESSGALISHAFDLSGYSAADLPRFYFDYYLDAAVGDSIRLTATSDQASTAIELVPGTGYSSDQWRQAFVDLGPLAGHTNIQIHIEYSVFDVADSGEGLYLDNFLVGFAERGEMILGAAPNETGFSGFGGGTAGQYQLEIRSGTDYGTPTAGGQLQIDRLFDTNDRHGRQVTLVAPAGSQLQDGDRFTLNDGANSLTFEFSTSAGFNPGVVRIQFNSSDTAVEIAQRMITALNSASVQNTLRIKASPASSNSNLSPTDPRINLTGAVIGDFESISSVADAPSTLSATALAGSGRMITLPAILHDGQGDSNVLRTQGQLIIDSNRISDVRGIGIWSEVPQRQIDPRDSGVLGATPTLGLAHSAAMNLPILNESVDGGLAPGAVIVNNIVDQAGYTGIKIDGEATTAILRLPTGLGISDGHSIVIDAAGTRIVLEFDDIAGVPVINGGSGTVGGDGFVDGHIPVYYRRVPAGTTTPQYPSGGRNTPSTELEILTGILQAINGSVLVSNNLAGLVDARIGPDPNGGGNVLYLTGASQIYSSNLYQKVGGSSVSSQFLSFAQAPQPFVRVVNNTIYGNDGTESQYAGAGTDEPNDTIAAAVDTKLGRSHKGAYVTTATLGDNQSSLPPDRDVDLYQVQLDVGDRLVVDIDTDDLGPETVLRLFDSTGKAHAFLTADGVISTLSQPGPLADYLDPASTSANLVADAANPRDGFIDFTATKKDTYYVGVSSLGNDQYDPLSLSGRQAGSGGTGQYTLGIEVYAPRDFVLSVDNGSDSQTGTRAGALIGTTFTITQIPDYVGAGSYAAVAAEGNRVTFEFSDNVAGAVLPNGNINVPLLTSSTNGGYRVPEIMQAIAQAIGRTVSGIPALPNHERGNGPGGITGPIGRVTAMALGGASGANNGLNLFGYTDYGSGFGHNRLENLSSSLTTSGGWSSGSATSELYVLVEKAARIELSDAARNAGLRLTPDYATPAYATEADQLLAENGVLVTQGASPTLVNNVFVNLHQSVVVEESAWNGFGGLVSANEIFRPQEVVVTGNVFQYNETRNSRIRADVSSPIGNRDPGLNTDATTGPSNVNGGSSDFNFIVPNSVRVLENAAGDRMTPAAGSPIIDSAINSLLERDSFGALKVSVGIPVSNILAPARDFNGQLRADDPNVASPGGLGANVFKDRGAIDRADFVGPVASLEYPRDNDAAGIDTDPAETFLQLNSGVYDEFRILLRDLGDSSDPFVGSGIDDATVVVPVLPGLREAGANISLFENDRLLTEKIDYTFSYDATRGLITLRPIAGIWRSDRAYRISINNQDRLVGLAPGAAAIQDGDSFVVVDSNGSEVAFEFESGYELRLPETLAVTVPAVGTGTGGIADGTRFSLTGVTGNPVFFEFDRDGVTLPGSRVVAFQLGDSSGVIATKIYQAVRDAVSDGLLDVSPVLSGNTVVVGAEAGTVLDASRTALVSAVRTLALSLPNAVGGPGGVADGDLLVISDGHSTVQFELDSDDNFNSLHTPISIGGITQVDQLRIAIIEAIESSPLGLQPFQVGNHIFLDLPVDGSASASGAISIVGVARTPADGSTITFTQPDGQAIRLVLDRTDLSADLPEGDRVIAISRQMTGDALAALVAEAIRSETIDGLDATAVHASRGGQIAIGGQAASLTTPGLGMVLDDQSTLQIVGAPGITGSSMLSVDGPLLLQLPATGGASMPDNSQFVLTDGLNTVTFQYNQELTGITNPIATPINFNSFDSVDQLAAATVAAINGSLLDITAVNLGGGRISLGNIDEAQLGVPEDPISVDPEDPAEPVIPAPLNPRRGIVADGEQIVITQGSQTLRLEFDASTGGGGVTAGFIPVVFEPSSSIDDVAAVLAAAINNNRGSMTLSAVAVAGGHVSIADTAQTSIDISQAATMALSGTPGGANPIRFSGAFGPEEMKIALIEAVNAAHQAGTTSLQALNRGGNTFFIENGLYLNGVIDSYYLQAVKDVAGNPLKPNRSDNSTQFTLLLPTVGLDYGDAPDPRGGVSGRYPTLLANDGARHVVNPDGVRLGHLIDIDADGLPSVQADGDDTTIFITGSSGTFFDAAVVSGAVQVGFAWSGDLQAYDGHTLTISTGVDTATFELDTDGLFNENHYAVTVDPSGTVTAATIAAALQQAIEESPLRPAGVVIDGNLVRILTDDEDGVVFGGSANPQGLLNPHVPLEFAVTVTGSGVLEAWIDFNFDGDWDDPNEQIISAATPGAIFTGQPGEATTRWFTIQVPASATLPAGSAPIETYARFRVSSDGGLQPTGLALSGEVEDYALTILAGSPPDINESNSQLSYTVDEDTALQAFDVDDTLTIGQSNDNGILAALLRQTTPVDPDGDEIAVYAGDTGIRSLTDAYGNLAGTLDLAADGTFRFEPAPDYFGTVTFTARVTDVNVSHPERQLHSPTPLTVTLNVLPVNDPPVAVITPVELHRTTQEDVAITFTPEELTAFYSPGPANEAGQTLLIQSAGIDGTGFQTVLGGVLQLIDGNLIYTPPTDFPGPGPDRFVYIVADDPHDPSQVSESSPTFGTVIIDIQAVNDPPVAGNDSFTFDVDAPYVITIGAPGVAGSLLGNDSAGPADEVAAGQTVELVRSDFPMATQRGGTVQLSADQTQLIYTPPANYNGPDQFDYRIRDNGSPVESATGTVQINILGAVNSPPQFIGINGDPTQTSLSFNESKETEQVFDYNLNSWFIDPEGDSSTYTVTSSRPGLITTELLTNPATGATTLRVRLQPYQFGTATLTVRATNIGVDSPLTSEVLVPVSVTNTPDPPVLIGTLDPLVVNEDETVIRNLATVFSDPDGTPLSYRVTRFDGIVNPTLSQIAASGLVQSISFVGDQMTIRLVPDAHGTVDIEITASDETTSVTDAFRLTVNSVADAPRGNADFYNVPTGGQLQMLNPASGLLANDSDPDGDKFPGTNETLRVHLPSVTAPQLGTVQVNADGTFVYTNISGVPGDVDSFTYRPIDPTGRMGSVVTVTLNMGRSLYQNPIPGYRADVTADGFVSPLDALRVLNTLSMAGTASMPVSSLTSPPPDYLDVDGNGRVELLDALIVLNDLAARNRGLLGEGEAVAALSASEVYAAAPISLPITIQPVDRLLAPVSTVSTMASPADLPWEFDPTTESAEVLALIRSQQAAAPAESADDDSPNAHDEALLDWTDATSL